MRLLPLLALLAAALGSAPTRAQPAGETIVILDLSGSMWGRIGQETKLDIAREAVRGMFSRFPADSRVGLMAFGHRQARACNDIEMLVPPGPVDQAAVDGVLGRLTARGRTPLTDSVREAARVLRVAERGGTIILVTDGIETCGGDPCALAAELEAANARFTAHVVGFDLRSPSERARVACIAERTGGTFTAAGDARELAEALGRTAQAQPAPRPVAAPRTTGLRATLGANGPALPGAVFTVLREGEETPVHEGAAARLALAPGRYVVTASTEDRIGSVTAELTAQGPAEIAVPLADALPRATLRPAVPSIGATELLEVAWEGPNERGDYLVFAPVGPNAEEPETRHYAYTADGSPARVRAPATAGAHEVRYVLARAGRTIGRAAVMVTPVTASVAAAAEAPAGSQVEIRWTGPRAPGSWIGITEAGSDAGAYIGGAYAWVEGAESPLRVTAPAAPGTYEIRFVEGVDGTVLARAPLRVTEARATIEAPATAMAGSHVSLRYAPGQAADGSFIAVVPPSAEPGAYIGGAYVNIDGGEGRLRLPAAPGAYEVRFVLTAPGGASVIARRPITLTTPVATLDAPATAAPGTPVAIRYGGPRGDGDFVTIVRPDAEAGHYEGWFGAEADGSAGEIAAPDAPGDYEIRYVMMAPGADATVIARRPVTVR
ncbi:VWA domain-containing protein [Neoroseomonas oryzicola]|uniref:VWA domain-containing protein n=1 Tax=Neoroseomonas oryzicola TaxID=535904 RepID=A0A9X9WL47_9PROT|nr:VWA domain-containing protein [Neoroseomonas oryzicola]MBR0661057.1 VWA domain-containing protein [Neoroseomonas oryzicola]NKE18294.1 VWA domain-containing protein [Neoroseomonas oryzicola]